MPLFDRLRRHRQPEPLLSRVPDGLRLYAIGDIHGCLDLHDRLLRAIVIDAESAAPGTALHLVYLGDFVDRGPQSRQVLDRLLQGPPPGFTAGYIRGNHEASMVRFLTDLSVGPSWYTYGGVETLASYGIHLPEHASALEKLRYGQMALRQHLPRAHIDFMVGLKPSLVIGDYFFCHAGVRPGVDLARQSADDLMWIREDFLDSDADFGKVVVHGHTISELPEIRNNRIGIDTGAFFSGRLTALVLDGDSQRFLQT